MQRVTFVLVLGLALVNSASAYERTGKPKLAGYTNPLSYAAGVMVTPLKAAVNVRNFPMRIRDCTDRAEDTASYRRIKYYSDIPKGNYGQARFEAACKVEFVQFNPAEFMMGVNTDAKNYASLPVLDKFSSYFPVEAKVEGRPTQSYTSIGITGFVDPVQARKGTAYYYTSNLQVLPMTNGYIISYYSELPIGWNDSNRVEIPSIEEVTGIFAQAISRMNKVVSVNVLTGQGFASPEPAFNSPGSSSNGGR